MQRFDDTCLSCRALQGLISLSIAPTILETPYWSIVHAHPTSIRGWLVLVVRRHCAALHDLTPEESASLGRLIPLACQALHATLQTQKEYVIQFAEAEGFDHVHFHIIACLPDWPASQRGTNVFSQLGDQVQNPLSSDVVTPVAMEIRGFLLEQLDPSELG